MALKDWKKSETKWGTVWVKKVKDDFPKRTFIEPLYINGVQLYRAGVPYNQSNYDKVTEFKTKKEAISYVKDYMRKH